MKIVVVLENYWPNIGGIEVMFNNLTRRLVERGHKVVIITHQIKGTSKNDMLDGVPIKRVWVPEFAARHWFSLLSIPIIWRAAKDADILHTTTYNAAFPTAVVGKLRRKPCIITVAEFLNHRWKSLMGMSGFSAWMHAFGEKIIARLGFSKYVAVSGYTEQTCWEAGVKKNQTLLIYDGLEKDFFDRKKYSGEEIRQELGIKKDEFIYTSYGRAGVTKGIEYLIMAMPTIIDQLPNSRLLLILDRQPKSRYDFIMKLIEERKLENNIILLTPRKRNELPNYILAANCVVVPSLTEGFGFTAAEACLLKQPIVTTTAGSLPEVVWGKVVKVRPGDVEDLAQGIIRMAKGQYETIPEKDFDWEKNCDEYERLYRQLISKNFVTVST